MKSEWRCSRVSYSCLAVFHLPSPRASEARQEGDVGIVFGLLCITLEQRAHGLPVAVIDGVEQGFALVGFGVGFGCLPDVFSGNVEAVFAHFCSCSCMVWRVSCHRRCAVRSSEKSERGTARTGQRETGEGRQTVCTWCRLSGRWFSDDREGWRAGV